MPSKRSFFNPTLFRKNLSRSWPLWGSITALACLVPLYLLLALLSSPGAHMMPWEFSDFLYAAAVYFAPMASFGYAVLAAMVVWSYQYTARSVGLMHTLPLHRTGLFFTNTLSGLAMLLIPYVAVGALLCLLALAWGFMDFGAVLATAASVLLMTVLFFGIATLCAMATGNIFALPVFYLVVNFAAPVMDALVGLLSRSFLVGVSSDYTGAVEFLSPLVQIYRTFRYERIRVSVDYYSYVLRGFGTVVIYGLVGIACFALAWLLYRRRESESAGNVVAFRWLRPVFRYGVALVFALTTGHALYALLWGNLFQKGQYAQAVPMALCMSLMGLVGYYAASMLLEKSLRVFRGSVPGASAVVVAAALICAGVSMDIFGAERYVPEPEEIDELYIYTSNMIGLTPNLNTGEHPEMIEKVLALHTAITEHVDELRDMPTGYSTEAREGEPPERVYQYVNFNYTLKDGTEVYRRYELYLTHGNWTKDVGIEAAFKALFAGTEIQLYQIQGPAGSSPGDVEVYCHADDHSSHGEPVELDEEALYQALLADAREGRLYDYDLFDDYYNDSYPVNIEVQYKTRRADPSPYEYEGYSYDYRSVELRPTMVHTVETLLEQGFITAEDLLAWNESYGIHEKYAVAPGPTAVFRTE